MRVCPKCGYVDPIWWRPAAYHQEHSYASFDVIQWNEPKLWEQLKDLPRGELLRIEPFFYWKSTRSDTIRRVWIEDYYLVGKSGNPQERVDHSPQLKITDVLKSEARCVYARRR